MSNGLDKLSKGLMKQNGKYFLPITHEALVVDNDGVSIKDKYLTKVKLDSLGLATQDFVSEAILKAQIPGGTVDLSKFALVEQLDLKASKDHTHDTKYAKKESEHIHDNKAVLDSITSLLIDEWNAKSNFSGAYEDLTGLPVIPSIEGLASEEFVNQKLQDAVPKEHLHSYNDLTDRPVGLATEQFVLQQIENIDVVSGQDLLTIYDETQADSIVEEMDRVEIATSQELLAMYYETQN